MSAYNVGYPGSIPGLGRSPGEGNGNPLQYSCLENPMDRRAWQDSVHRVTKSRTQLSKFSFSLMTNEVEHPVGHLYVFFGELFKFFAQFQKLHYHFTVDLQEFFVNPDISPLLDIQFADIFSHSMGFLFYFLDGIF